jgi:hypothetical protein
MMTVRAREPGPSDCPHRSGRCCAEDIEAEDIEAEDIEAEDIEADDLEAEDIEPGAVPARVFGLGDHCGATHAVYRKPPATHPVALRSRAAGSA